jgi:serine phosphatase RsbU (regulator of sigma subunit)
MGFRFTISKKIGAGFATLILTTLVLVSLTYATLSTGRKMNENINDIYNPSVFALEKLKSDVLRSKTLISMWAGVQSREDTKEKLSLKELLNNDIPSVRQNIDSLSYDWTEQERRKKEKIYNSLDELFALYNEVQTTLVDIQSYDLPFARFAMVELVEEGGKIDQQSQKVLEELNELIESQRINISADSDTMISSFDKLQVYIMVLGFGLLVSGLVIATLTVRSIVVPVKSLRENLLILGKGQFPEEPVPATSDEIGEMGEALEKLVDGLRRTTEFSNDVKVGNFETEYQPLSEKDNLGIALLEMREELKKRDEDYRRDLAAATKDINDQKDKIAEQNNQRKILLEDITASIKYASRLQENILPSPQMVKRLLKESFVFFRPKDIVSGDFYFVDEHEGKVIFAAVDCTGHGVPGAFMSLVGHNALTNAIRLNPELNPAAILKDLNRLSLRALNSEKNEAQSMRDGMDLALCVLDRKEGVLEFAGAHNRLYLVRNGVIDVYKGDKIGIGSAETVEEEFTRYKISTAKDDMIYIFTDGYPDQFGGKNGKKFMYDPFRRMLKSIALKPVQEQSEILGNTLDEWQNSGQFKQEQIDDILIMGVRV